MILELIVRAYYIERLMYFIFFRWIYEYEFIWQWTTARFTIFSMFRAIDV